MNKYIKNGFKCIEKFCFNKVGQKGNKCKSCATKYRQKIPENNPNYKHGKSSKYIKNGYNCIKKCGRKVSHKYKFCIPCFAKELKRKHLEKIINFEGKNNPFYGKHHTKKTKKKLKLLKLGRKLSKKIKRIFYLAQRKRIHPNNCQCCICKAKNGLLLGRKNPNYKNGLSKFPYPLKFNRKLKKRIRIRDNYICQCCGISETQSLKKFKEILSVHHIDYNKFNLKEENLISVCRSCNSKSNSKRTYWKKYFKIIINKIYKNRG